MNIIILVAQAAVAIFTARLSFIKHSRLQPLCRIASSIPSVSEKEKQKTQNTSRQKQQKCVSIFMNEAHITRYKQMSNDEWKQGKRTK